MLEISYLKNMLVNLLNYIIIEKLRLEGSFKDHLVQNFVENGA